MRTELIAFRLGLPSSLDTDTVAGWLDTVAAAAHPPHFALVMPPPTTLEIVATKQGISYYLIVHSNLKRLASAGLRGTRRTRIEEETRNGTEQRTSPVNTA